MKEERIYPKISRPDSGETRTWWGLGLTALFLSVLLSVGTAYWISRSASSSDVAHHDTGTSVEHLHFLYDMTPVSASNPVIVRIPDCSIEISWSEFRAFIAKNPIEAALRQTASTNGSPPLRSRSITMAQKKEYLDKLVNEHFWTWDGYRQGADRTADIMEQLDYTLRRTMEEALMDEAIGQASTPEEQDNAREQLRDRLFEKAEITVSISSYEEMKTIAKRMNHADAVFIATLDPKIDEILEPSSAQEIFKQLSPEVRDCPLAKSEVGVVTIGMVLNLYSQCPLSDRPQLEQPESLNLVFKDLIGDRLVLQEARHRGLERSYQVRQAVQQNRNFLVRMWAMNRVSAKADEMARGINAEPLLRLWYQENLKGLYTVKDEKGRERVCSFEREKEQITADYFSYINDKMQNDYIHELRQRFRIEVNETLLEKW